MAGDVLAYDGARRQTNGESENAGGIGGRVVTIYSRKHGPDVLAALHPTWPPISASAPPLPGYRPMASIDH
jgi:hypothetical protein